MTNDRPHKDKPQWLLEYFAPMHKFGESYREELQARRKESAAIARARPKRKEGG